MKKSNYTKLGMLFTIIGGLIHISGGNKYLAMLGPTIGLIVLFYGVLKKDKEDM